MMYGSGKDICSSLRGFVVLRVLFAKGFWGFRAWMCFPSYTLMENVTCFGDYPHQDFPLVYECNWTYNIQVYFCSLPQRNDHDSF